MAPPRCARRTSATARGVPLLHEGVRRFSLGAALAVAFASAPGCSKTPTGTLTLTTGGEGDALTRAPAPTTLAVDLVDAQGKVTSLGVVSLPATTVSLPDQSTSAIGIVRVTGADAAGATRVFGESLPVEFSGLAGGSVTIFIQRTGELARLPGALPDGREAPLLGLVAGRYVLVAGGSDSGQAKTTALYDLLSWATLPSPPTHPRAPRSLAAFVTRVLAIDDQGASAFDLTDSSASEVTAPGGGSFAEVAGGATIYPPDGSAYVVGATRTAGMPTARVLKIDATGAFSFLALGSPRLGATAAWVPGRGLYVGGGNATAPGAEMIAAGATASVALPFPSDASVGAGSVALDASHVLVAGGVRSDGSDAGTRLFDLGCATACMPQAWPAPLASPLPGASVFVLPGAAALVVGDDAAGLTHVVRLDAKSATEISLKAGRKHARGILLPTGQIAVAGGAAVIEGFAP